MRVCCCKNYLKWDYSPKIHNFSPPLSWRFLLKKTGRSSCNTYRALGLLILFLDGLISRGMMRTASIFFSRMRSTSARLNTNIKMKRKINMAATTPAMIPIVFCTEKWKWEIRKNIKERPSFVFRMMRCYFAFGIVSIIEIIQRTPC